MNSIQKILVGLDVQDHGTQLTRGSRAVATQALWLGRELGAQVDFLHSVFDDPEQRGSFAVGGESGAEGEAVALHAESGVSGAPWSVVQERLPVRTWRRCEVSKPGRGRRQTSVRRIPCSNRSLSFPGASGS